MYGLGNMLNIVLWPARINLRYVGGSALRSIPISSPSSRPRPQAHPAMPVPPRKPYHPQSILHQALVPAKELHISLSKRISAVAPAILLLIMGQSVGLSTGIAQTTKPSKATVLQIVGRQELFIDRRRAKEKDTAQQPESLKTLQCTAQLTFTSGSGGRMLKGSTLRLGDCLFISQGSVLVSGPMCACSGSIKVCSKNTNYILEALANGDAAATSLEGSLDVQFLESNLSTPRPAMVVNSGQRLRLYQEQGFTTVVDLTPDDYRQIFERPLFRGFRERLPSQGALEDYLQAHVPGVTIPEPEPVPAAKQSNSPLFLLPLLLDFTPRLRERSRPMRPNNSYE